MYIARLPVIGYICSLKFGSMIFPPFEYNHPLMWMYFGFLGVAFIQLFYYWGIFSRLAFFRSKPETTEKPPVSVVVCAKNEYMNLQENLTGLLSQNYPEYEVVVVNDASDDDTYYLLKLKSETHKNLSVVTINQNLNFFTGKKFPLSIGIRSAKNGILLLTDADCIPSSPEWISEMVSNYRSNTDIVLGYSGFMQRAGFFNRLIRFEGFYTGMQYLSLALAGMPYMGVGRNLSYRKSLFFKNNGFISHYKISSGDDDLFINKVANKRNTTISVNENCLTKSEGKSGFSDWVRQKRRHLTTGHFYRFPHKVVLGMLSLSQFLFYGLFAALLILSFPWQFVLPVFGLRLISQLFIVKRCMNVLKERSFLLISPVLEVILMLLIPLIALTNPFVRKNKWK
jgi:glycosyltransferase involved in cell wall biosynthesis